MSRCNQRVDGPYPYKTEKKKRFPRPEDQHKIVILFCPYTSFPMYIVYYMYMKQKRNKKWQDNFRI